MEIEAKKKSQIMESLSRQSKYSKITLTLVSGDLDYGVDYERIQGYLKDNYNDEQRAFYSNCLRMDIDDEALRVIADRKNNVEQMKVAYEFYKRGVPLEQIKTVLNDNQRPIMMRKELDKILDEISIVEKSIPEDKEYVEDMVKQVKEAVFQIFGNGEKYDRLFEAIANLSNQNENQANEELTAKIVELEKLLDDQQNKLIEADKANKKYKERINSLEKEIDTMNEHIEKVNDKMQKQLEDMRERRAAYERKSQVTAQKVVEKQAMEKQAVEKQAVEDTVGIDLPTQAARPMAPIYYTIPIIDENGRVVHYAPVDKSDRSKNNKSALATIFSKLSFKKKAKQDMIKILSSGELDKSQLIQIKNAVIKGLTPDQITNLIVNKIDADKMEEIIEIAVLENREA